MSKNVFCCRRLSFFFLQSFCFLRFFCFLLLLLSRNLEKQFENNMQNIVLENKIVAFCFRAKTITKKIIVQKQVTTTRKFFVAQELQLQNITINNIYIFVSIVSIDLRTLINTFTINFLLKFNSFIAIFSSVLYRYLDDIFYNKLNIKNIIKFIVDFFFVVATNAINFFDAKNLLDLFRIFDIYIFIAFSFVSHLIIK